MYSTLTLKTFRGIFRNKVVIQHLANSNFKISGFLTSASVLYSDCSEKGSNNKKMDKEDLKQRLTPLQYHVTQEAGTERPFTGCYNKCYDQGMYQCIVCKQELFSSQTKYDSGCGWPAFNDVLDKKKVTLHKDTSSGLVRTEVRCSSCGAHLGHVFDDGPAPTKKRFCINSASLDFVPGKSGDENKS